MELVEILDGPASEVVDQFMLVFRGSPNTAFEEGTYEVAPEGDASFELFLQPTGSDAAGRDYLASVSLIKPLVAAPDCA